VKVIFDENVPLPLQQFLAGHLVTTVQQEGWTGTENGDLLKLVDGKFDVLLLADKNLRYQQNLTPRRSALVELPTNRWPALKRLYDKIRQAIDDARPGGYTIIE